MFKWHICISSFIWWYQFLLKVINSWNTEIPKDQIWGSCSYKIVLIKNKERTSPCNWVIQKTTNQNNVETTVLYGWIYKVIQRCFYDVDLTSGFWPWNNVGFSPLKQLWHMRLIQHWLIVDIRVIKCPYVTLILRRFRRVIKRIKLNTKYVILYKGGTFNPFLIFDIPIEYSDVH